jgi:hypothetical protein
MRLLSGYTQNGALRAFLILVFYYSSHNMLTEATNQSGKHQTDQWQEQERPSAVSPFRW